MLPEAGIAYRDRLADVAMGRAAASEAAFVEAVGTIVDLAQDERAAWAAAIPILNTLLDTASIILIVLPLFLPIVEPLGASLI